MHNDSLGADDVPLRGCCGCVLGDSVGGDGMVGQLSFIKNWKYAEDNATLMAECPECERRMVIHCYAYGNPYHYCPYCGQKLEEGNVMSAGSRIYGWSERRRGCQ